MDMMEEIVLGPEVSSDSDMAPMYSEDTSRLSSTRLKHGKSRSNDSLDDEKPAFSRRRSAATLVFGAEGLGEESHTESAEHDIGGVMSTPASTSFLAPMNDSATAFRREISESGLGLVYLDSDSDDEMDALPGTPTSLKRSKTSPDRTLEVKRRRRGVKRSGFSSLKKSFRRENSLSGITNMFRGKARASPAPATGASPSPSPTPLATTIMSPAAMMKKQRQNRGWELEVAPAPMAIPQETVSAQPAEPGAPISIGLQDGESFVGHQENLERFNTQAVGKDTFVLTTIIRGKQKVNGEKFNGFTLWLQLAEDEPQLVLAAVRKNKGKKLKWMIGDSPRDICRGRLRAKLRSKYLSIVYKLYDNGRKPDEPGGGPVRKFLGETRFVQRQKDGGPRQLVVNIADPDPAPTRSRPIRTVGAYLNDDEDSDDEVMSPADSAVPSFDTSNGLATFVNTQPQWDEQRQAYALKFNGRATMASVKNFQLIRDGAPEPRVLFQLGKVGKNTFNLDFRYPFSPVQAFSIAIANLEGTLRESIGKTG